MEAIRTNNLTKHYGEARGIIDVNLSVKEGDFFGFIGPNGAGKSTTIRTLLGLIKASSGSASILGMDISKNRTDILKQIGYLPAEAMFYNGMRVKDILKLSARLYNKDCSKECSALCERLQLDTSKKVQELSLGNRKKVAIICAMQHKPKLYIFDEPTSGLDPLMQREFYTILKERNEEGATIFLSSHILSEVQHYCKNTAVIKEGRILVCDSVERLGNTGVKYVSLQGIKQLPKLENVKNVKTSQEGISFLYSGNPQTLLKALADLDITDISIGEPDLEDVFMHYYVKEENANDSL